MTRRHVVFGHAVSRLLYTAHQGWQPLCRRLNLTAPSGPGVTQPTAVSTTPFLSVIIWQMRIGDQPVNTTIQVVCTPPGASEPATAVDWPEMVDTRGSGTNGSSEPWRLVGVTRSSERYIRKVVGVTSSAATRGIVRGGPASTQDVHAPRSDGAALSQTTSARSATSTETGSLWSLTAPELKMTGLPVFPTRRCDSTFAVDTGA